ncbi:hypothetical protein F8N00_11425 [Exiguobacterium sp. A1_3_1]|uniref:hypothetical protein n=1 Tax=Exiguobacterium sp. A1_3_1 TaxID=2651871 RepID=UPI003B87D656
MGISNLQKATGAVANYWDLYPRRFTGLGSRTASSTTFASVISITGEGYIDFAGLAAYGSTGGGSGNEFGLRLTVDGVVLIGATFNGSNSGARYAGFYARNATKPFGTGGIEKVGDGATLAPGGSDYLGAIYLVLQGYNAANINARTTFPMGEGSKILEAPIFFKSSVVAEVYRAGYFTSAGALITGGMK